MLTGGLSGLFSRGFLSSARKAVNGLNDRIGGDGRGGDHVDFSGVHGNGLADELVLERILHRVLAKTGGLAFRVNVDDGDRVAVEGNGDGHVPITKALSGGRLLLTGGLSGSFSSTGQAVDGLDDCVGGDGRGGNHVNLSGVHRDGLADELILEAVLHRVLAKTGGLAFGVNVNCGDRVAVEDNGDGHVPVAEALGGGGLLVASRGSGSCRYDLSFCHGAVFHNHLHGGFAAVAAGRDQLESTAVGDAQLAFLALGEHGDRFRNAGQAVQRLDGRVRGDGRAGQDIHPVADGHRQGLAGELGGEFIGGTALADAIRFIGGVHSDAQYGAAVLIEEHAHGHIAAETLRRRGRRVLRNGDSRSAVCGLGLAEADQAAIRSVLLQRQLPHGLHGRIACGEHGAGSARRAGQGFKLSAVRGQAHQTAHVFLGAPASAKTVGFSEVAVADDGLFHVAGGADTQGDRHRSAIALRPGLDRVTHQIAVGVLGAHQVGHAVIAGGGNGDFLVALGGHHSGEGRLEFLRFPLPDGSFGDGVRQAEGQRGHQRDDSENRPGGQGLPCLLSFHVASSPFILRP